MKLFSVQCSMFTRTRCQMEVLCNRIFYVSVRLCGRVCVCVFTYLPAIDECEWILDMDRWCVLFFSCLYSYNLLEETITTSNRPKLDISIFFFSFIFPFLIYFFFICLFFLLFSYKFRIIFSNIKFCMFISEPVTTLDSSCINCTVVHIIQYIDWKWNQSLLFASEKPTTN